MANERMKLISLISLNMYKKKKHNKHDIIVCTDDDDDDYNAGGAIILCIWKLVNIMDCYET
jgi:hypothetical protein